MIPTPAVNMHLFEIFAEAEAVRGLAINPTQRAA
jgi:hypothetical protein